MIRFKIQTSDELGRMGKRRAISYLLERETTFLPARHGSWGKSEYFVFLFHFPQSLKLNLACLLFIYLETTLLPARHGPWGNFCVNILWFLFHFPQFFKVKFGMLAFHIPFINIFFCFIFPNLSKLNLTCLLLIYLFILSWKQKLNSWLLLLIQSLVCLF